MLLMDRVKGNGLKAPAFASLALAFASFGDAFLYPFLPVNNVVVGVPLVWVGVLLSINRFVRIFSNAIMVHLFARYGLRIVMICAVLLAIISTAGYTIASGVLVWLLFRIFWGISFSAMRIGTLGYALQHSRQGFALGLSRSFQEAGPMLALFLAPVLLMNFEIRSIFFLLAAFSLPALWFAWKLPEEEVKTRLPVAGRFLKFPSSINAITLFSAIVIDGILVVALGILFLHYRENISLINATTLAAFYLGYRRICLVAFSPAGGWIADRVGLDKVFAISMAFVILGLLVLMSGWIATGSVIVFTFYSINAAIVPATVSKNHVHSLAAVAENATWRDIGAATGTLAGGFLIASSHLTTVLLITIFSLLILLLIHSGTAKRLLNFCTYGSNGNL
jgi:MFS family permease